MNGTEDTYRMNAASPWYLDHLVLAGVLIIFAGVLGMLAGAGAAWACVANHLVSPDNPLAGAAMGFGGVILGAGAGALAVTRKGRRR